MCGLDMCPGPGRWGEPSARRANIRLGSQLLTHSDSTSFLASTRTAAASGGSASLARFLVEGEPDVPLSEPEADSSSSSLSCDARLLLRRRSAILGLE